jgi:hypothetical protein
MISAPSRSSIPFGSGVALVILENEVISEDPPELVCAPAQTPAMAAHRKSGMKETIALRAGICFSK